MKFRRDYPQSWPWRPACTGGQGTSPHEQNTQQSPGFGFKTAPQAGQSQKNWQASVGMRKRVAVPHFGQVIVLSSCKADAALPVSGVLDAWGAQPSQAASVASVTGACFGWLVIGFQLCWIGNGGCRG
jgi:hypothetical protein